ncbi:MAG: hypothetical protein OEO21_05290 [Candidatus Krumholzibacteria bacterium]|nr:hypothetical protein [Candidatus Krumholzibacteria bacterium]
MNPLAGVGLCVLVLSSSPPTHAQTPTDTIRVGSPAVNAKLLTLGSVVVENFVEEDGVRTLRSRTRQTIVPARAGDNDVVVLRVAHETEGDTTQTVLVLRRDDLALLHHSVRAARDSASVTVSGLHVTGWAVLPNAPARLIDARLEHPVFPVEGQIPWLMGLLPLAEGYVAVIPYYSQWQDAFLWRRIEVVASESVQVGGAPVDCWKIDAGPLGPPGYRMTRWIDKRTRRVVQSALLGKPGEKAYWAHATAP